LSTSTSSATSRTALPPVTVQDVLARVERARRTGEGRWTACCPAHEDRTPSLSIREGDDGKVLIHCFGGCELVSVMSALGLRLEQLFPARNEPGRPRRARKRDDVRQEFARLLARRRSPAPDRMRRELILVGRLLAAGTAGFRSLPDGFTGERFQCCQLRVLFEAMSELVRQGTPRRWFSALALAREADRAGGPGTAVEYGIYFWARLAIGTARRSGR
jgi:hypothetical protein